jgi:hypothetical protein
VLSSLQPALVSALRRLKEGEPEIMLFSLLFPLLPYAKGFP